MTRTNKTSGPADGVAVSLDEPLLDCVAAGLLNITGELVTPTRAAQKMDELTDGAM